MEKYDIEKEKLKLKEIRKKKFGLQNKLYENEEKLEKYKNDEVLVKLTIKELQTIDDIFSDAEELASNLHLQYEYQYQIWIKIINILLKMLEKRGDNNEKN